MKRKIFVVDDDSDIRKLIKHKLQNDFDIEEFPHWQDAKRRLVKRQPHLFILDIMYSDGTIIEFLKFRDQQLDLRKIPVIVFSASKDRKIINQILNFEIAEYILKPFNPSLLSNAVQRLLGNRKDFSLLKGQEYFELEMPITFPQISEISMVAETSFRLVEGREYNVHSDYFVSCDLPTQNLYAMKNSTLSPSKDKFVTPFRVRGASEKFLKKVRVGDRE